MPETKLIDIETGEEIKPGHVIKKDDYDTIEAPYTVTGYAAPRHPGSSGRVYVRTSTGHDREFFPHVFGFRVVEVKEEQGEAAQMSKVCVEVLPALHSRQMTGSQIVKALPMFTAASLSHALAVLVKKGLVSRTGEGKGAVFGLTEEGRQFVNNHSR